MKPSKRIIKLLSFFSLIFGVLSLIWLIYDYVLYIRLKEVTLGFTELGKLEKLAEFVWLSYLYFFVYHILANGTLILQSRYFRKIKAVNVAAMMVGVVSFLCLFGDWAVLGDIGKEYKMGWDTSGEWKILYIFIGIHTVYMLMVTSIFAGLMWRKELLEKDKAVEQKDEMVFTLAQFVGIVCGLIGIAYTVMVLIVSVKLNINMNTKATVYHMVSTTILILIPYGMVVIYWLVLKLKEKMVEWYDEKQWRDVTRAALATLLISIPILGLFFFAVTVRHLSYSAALLWFPFTLFLILFLFSLITLINYRRS